MERSGPILAADLKRSVDRRRIAPRKDAHPKAAGKDADE
jgi:hypothetical protein